MLTNDSLMLDVAAKESGKHVELIRHYFTAGRQY